MSVGDKLINASTNEKITVEKIYFNLNETNELNENSNMIFTTMEEKNINSNDILIKNYEGILRTDSFNANIFGVPQICILNHQIIYLNFTIKSQKDLYPKLKTFLITQKYYKCKC